MVCVLSINVYFLFSQVSDLEGQIAKLRANMERNEASKANIEFELTRTKRDLAQQKHSAVGRENTLEEANKELKRNINTSVVNTF